MAILWLTLLEWLVTELLKRITFSLLLKLRLCLLLLDIYNWFLQQVCCSGGQGKTICVVWILFIINSDVLRVLCEYWDAETAVCSAPFVLVCLLRSSRCCCCLFMCLFICLFVCLFVFVFVWIFFLLQHD